MFRQVNLSSDRLVLYFTMSSITTTKSSIIMVLSSSFSPAGIHSPLIPEEGIKIHFLNLLGCILLLRIYIKHMLQGNWICVYSYWIIQTTVYFSIGPSSVTTTYSGFFNQLDFVRADKYGSPSRGHVHNEWFEGRMLPWFINASL